MAKRLIKKEVETDVRDAAFKAISGHPAGSDAGDRLASAMLATQAGVAIKDIIFDDLRAEGPPTARSQ